MWRASLGWRKQQYLHVISPSRGLFGFPDCRERPHAAHRQEDWCMADKCMTRSAAINFKLVQACKEPDGE